MKKIRGGLVARQRCAELRGASLLTMFLLSLASGSPLSAQGHPAVFVHGLTGNASSWTSTASWLGAQVAIDPIVPTLGWANAFQSQASSLHSVLGANNDVVGTGGSNGGIVLRTYLQQYGGASKIDRVMIVGSLHQGAQLATNVLNGQLPSYASLLAGTILGPFSYYLTKDAGFQPTQLILDYADALVYLAYFLPALVQGTGFDFNMPVLQDMGPASAHITSLNAGIGAEIANTTDRVSVRTSVDPSNAIFTALGADQATATAWGNFRSVLHGFAFSMFIYYSQHPDPELYTQAYRWDLLAQAMAEMDIDWGLMIGSATYPVVFPHDGVVSLATQTWAAATHEEDFLWPSHNIPHKEQKNDPNVREFMLETFEDTFKLGEPDPPPGPLEVDIQGPSIVPEHAWELCSWTAVTTGGSGNKSYTWSWDGQLTPPPVPGEYWWGNTGTEGWKWIEVTVTDSSGSDYDSMQVYVDASTEFGDCF